MVLIPYSFFAGTSLEQLWHVLGTSHLQVLDIHTKNWLFSLLVRRRSELTFYQSVSSVSVIQFLTCRSSMHVRLYSHIFVFRRPPTT